MKLLSIVGKSRVVLGCALALPVTLAAAGADAGSRSEERRVGKECLE